MPALTTPAASILPSDEGAPLGLGHLRKNQLVTDMESASKLECIKRLRRREYRMNETRMLAIIDRDANVGDL